MSSEWYLSLKLSEQILYAILIHPVTLHVYILIILNFNNLFIFLIPLYVIFLEGSVVIQRIETLFTTVYLFQFNFHMRPNRFTVLSLQLRASAGQLDKL
jgi:hypothetical protein